MGHCLHYTESFTKKCTDLWCDFSFQKQQEKKFYMNILYASRPSGMAAQARRQKNFNTHKTCLKCHINDKRLAGNKHTSVGWDDRENR
jgi:hypothetical protein